jgi:hypothetical protein
MPIGLRAKKKASQCLISLFAPAVSWRQKDSGSMQRKLLLGANKLQLDTERVTVRDSASNFNTAASIECWLIVLRLIGSFRSRRRQRETAQPTDRVYLSACFLFNGMTWPYCPGGSTLLRATTWAIQYHRQRAIPSYDASFWLRPTCLLF